ncbi:uncharacterized protein KY384_007678 [Bacidia gigantensis]|uniref:uncharacterized protein n=1 Tax=Bacidia gigantensis TaxID=2732470 RepID=UPI001D043B60|nr:uncharacterized protein KY384_007678 [Bacidia gigantensis]KAG8527526.1 hypothetical protein KY384_007678 [Bacidia gigantensis]
MQIVAPVETLRNDDAEADTNLIDAYSDSSPLARKLRRMPGTYPDSPVRSLHEQVFERPLIDASSIIVPENNTSDHSMILDRENVVSADGAMHVAASDPSILSIQHMSRKRKMLSANKRLALQEAWEAQYGKFSQMQPLPVRRPLPRKSCLRGHPIPPSMRTGITFHESPSTGAPVTKRKRYDEELPTYLAMGHTSPKSRPNSTASTLFNRPIKYTEFPFQTAKLRGGGIPSQQDFKPDFDGESSIVSATKGTQILQQPSPPTEGSPTGAVEVSGTGNAFLEMANRRNDNKEQLEKPSQPLRGAKLASNEAGNLVSNQANPAPQTVVSQESSGGPSHQSAPIALQSVPVSAASTKQDSATGSEVPQQIVHNTPDKNSSQLSEHDIDRAPIIDTNELSVPTNQPSYRAMFQETDDKSVTLNCREEMAKGKKSSQWSPAPMHATDRASIFDTNGPPLPTIQPSQAAVFQETDGKSVTLDCPEGLKNRGDTTQKIPKKSWTTIAEACDSTYIPTEAATQATMFQEADKKSAILHCHEKLDQGIMGSAACEIVAQGPQNRNLFSASSRYESAPQPKLLPPQSNPQEAVFQETDNMSVRLDCFEGVEKGKGKSMPEFDVGPPANSKAESPSQESLALLSPSRATYFQETDDTSVILDYAEDVKKGKGKSMPMCDVGSSVSSKVEGALEESTLAPLSQSQAAVSQETDDMSVKLDCPEDVKKRDAMLAQKAVVGHSPSDQLTVNSFPEVFDRYPNTRSKFVSTSARSDAGVLHEREEGLCLDPAGDVSEAVSTAPSISSAHSSSQDLTAGVEKLGLSITAAPPTTSSDRRSSRRVTEKAAKKAEEAARIAKEEREARERVRRDTNEQALRDGVRRVPSQKVIQPLPEGAGKLIQDALSKPMKHCVAVMSTEWGPRITKTDISRRDIGMVLPQPGTEDSAAGWLNDTMIDAYMQLIVGYENKRQGHKRNERPKVYAWNSYFYKSLRDNGYGSVARFAQKRNFGGQALLQMDYIFIPVNATGNHWTMAIVSPRRRTIEYFDSFHGTSGPHIRIIKSWLKGELGKSYEESEWTVVEQQGLKGRGGGPAQNNGSDCGVFAVTTAKMVTLGVDPMAVSADDMPLQRRRIVAEVINGSFDGDFAPIVEFY